jgi:hypothetical protein
VTQLRNEAADLDVGTDRRADGAHPPARRRPYRAPALRRLGAAPALLEALGPAQAAYGGPPP